MTNVTILTLIAHEQRSIFECKQNKFFIPDAQKYDYILQKEAVLYNFIWYDMLLLYCYIHFNNLTYKMDK